MSLSLKEAETLRRNRLHLEPVAPRAKPGHNLLTADEKDAIGRIGRRNKAAGLVHRFGPRPELREEAVKIRLLQLGILHPHIPARDSKIPFVEAADRRLEKQLDKVLNWGK